MCVSTFQRTLNVRHSCNLFVYACGSQALYSASSFGFSLHLYVAFLSCILCPIHNVGISSQWHVPKHGSPPPPPMAGYPRCPPRPPPQMTWQLMSAPTPPYGAVPPAVPQAQAQPTVNHPRKATATKISGGPKGSKGGDKGGKAGKGSKGGKACNGEKGGKQSSHRGAI